MAVFTPSANDPAVYTTDKFPILKDSDGNTYTTVVKANVNGNFDVYSKGTGFLGGDELLYQYNATRNVVNFDNGKFKDKPTTAYNSFFQSTGSNGNQIFKDIKTTWYGEAPPNSATRMATLDGYKSIAATTPRRTQGTTVGSVTIQTPQGPLTITGSTPDADAAIAAQLNKGAVLTGDIGKGGEAAGARSSYGNLYYPQTLNDIRRSQQDRIIFTMFKYAPATFNTNIGAQTITREIKDSLGTVTLPIQPSITDGNSADWSGGSINPIQALAVGGSLNMMSSSTPKEFFDKGLDLVRAASLAFANNDAFKEAGKIYLAQEAVGVQNLLSRTSGAILNPNLELLFNGPSLRNFAFTFRLSARDETEATQIRKIIRFFKQGMAVKKTTQNVFLKAPNVFGIDYKTIIDGKLVFHPSLNRIKKCALIACDVDYTPDGTYMTFNDDAKTITSYQLSLRFSELEPIYESDYNDIDGITTFNKQGNPLNGSYDSGGIGY